MEMVQIVETLEKIKEFFRYSVHEDETGEAIEVDARSESYDEIDHLYEIADTMNGRPIDVLRPRLAMNFRALMNQIGPIDIPEDVEDEEKEKIYKNIELVIKDLLLIAGTIYADGNYERG